LVEAVGILAMMLMVAHDAAQSIMLPYLDMVEEEIFRLLSDYKSGEQHDGLMWMALISLLGRSFEVDDGCESCRPALLQR
jgi:hypothetical protein